MVMPTPFERMLQQVQELATRDPPGAFAKLDELYGKSLTDLDVRHLGALAAHVGGAVLGRWDQAIAFVERCLEHDALEQGEESERSLHRALAVLHSCAGDEDRATDHIAAGVRDETDHARVAIMCAQTLVARRKYKRARQFLQQAAELCPAIHPEQDVVQQIAAIATNIARHAEAQLHVSRDLLLAAGNAASAACARLPDWRARHKAMYQQARSYLLAGRTTQALAIVQHLMALEQEKGAGAVEQFFTANLACRAQIQRGQLKVAARAYGACQQLAGQVEDPVDVERVTAAMDKLTADLERDKAERDRIQEAGT